MTLTPSEFICAKAIKATKEARISINQMHDIFSSKETNIAFNVLLTEINNNPKALSLWEQEVKPALEVIRVEKQKQQLCEQNNQPFDDKALNEAMISFKNAFFKVHGMVCKKTEDKLYDKFYYLGEEKTPNQIKNLGEISAKASEVLKNAGFTLKQFQHYTSYYEKRYIDLKSAGKDILTAFLNDVEPIPASFFEKINKNLTPAEQENLTTLIKFAAVAPWISTELLTVRSQYNYLAHQNSYKVINGKKTNTPISNQFFTQLKTCLLNQTEPNFGQTTTNETHFSKNPVVTPTGSSQGDGGQNM